MYVWVDEAKLSPAELRALQDKHIQNWLKNWVHAFGEKAYTTQALLLLRRIAERDQEVWDALLILSKWQIWDEGQEDNYDGGLQKETKPEGIWNKPTGDKAPRWEPKKQTTLF